MFISYISKGNEVIYTDTNPIFKSSIAAIAFLNIFRPFRLAKGVIYHKEYWITCTWEVLSVLIGCMLRGALGGTWYRNTVRKIGKYRNSTKYRYRRYDWSRSLRVCHVKHVCTRNQPQTLRENMRRPWIDQFNDWKAQSLPLSVKSLKY